MLGAIVLLCTLFSADISADLARAQDLLLRGNYAEADEILVKLEKEGADDEADRVSLALARARCASSRGKYADAEKILTAAGKTKESPKLLAELAEIDLLHGRLDAAQKNADRAIALDDNQLLARWIRAQVLEATGKHDQADTELEWFIDYYNNVQPTDPEELMLVAQAVSLFAGWNKLHDEFSFILNEVLVDASADNENFWPANWFAGMLFLDKYNKAEGIPELRKALGINPSAAPVLVGLGDAALQDYDFVEGKNFAEQALEINPNLPAALRVKADLLFADDKTDAAIEVLEKALTINPVSEETLGRLAACYYLRQRAPEAEKIEEEVLARNPQPGTFFAVLADKLEVRRQFLLAELFYRKAIEAAPYLPQPLNGLALMLMRLGREDEAGAIFEQARDHDPFHVRTSNMVKVLKHLEDYKVFEGDHYLIYVRGDADPLLGKYMSDYMEKRHQALCDLFGYEPPEKTLIEVMVDHKWFSARVVGLPSIGTVGACTGKMVALTSPRSLGQPYNWARVLDHEVTHIITLQQTNYNIPHWYTEALAVYSEGYPRPQVWNKLLAERVPKRDLLNLETINHAFIRPKTQLDWQMAYCQSLLYAEYMMRDYGRETISKLLDAYRDGLETPEAIPKVFGVSVEKFEEGYLKYLDDVVKDMRVGTDKKELSFAETERALRDDPNNPDLMVDLAMHNLLRRNFTRARELANEALKLRPKSPGALYVLARMELSIGKVDEALEILEPGLDIKDPNPKVLELLAGIYLRQKKYARAAELYALGQEKDPFNNLWMQGLARVYLESGERDKLSDALVELADREADDLKVRKKLAELAAEDKDWKEAARWANEVLHVDVSDPSAHAILGRAAAANKNWKEAASEFETAIELNPKNTALLLELGEVYLQQGKKDAAKKLAEKARLADPTNADASKLTKEAQE